MNDAGRLADLERLIQSAPVPWQTQLLAVGASLALLAAVLWLVRRRALGVEFTAVWIAVAVGAMALSISTDLLGLVTRLLGAWTPRSTVFFFAQFFLIATCLHYAVRLTRLSLQVKNLSQEVALLSAELETLRAPSSRAE
ncbi:MAG: DUF2304 domain-containing protein [Myxococcota bacterium]